MSDRDKEKSLDQLPAEKLKAGKMKALGTICNWPMRFTCLSPAEQKDDALLCVTAFLGRGYHGWEAFVADQLKIKKR